MATANVGGTELFYDDLGGDGLLCLVMHGGLGLDHTYLRPALDRLAPRLRVVYYDHRSNGRSGRPPLETLTMEQLADDAVGLAEHLGADRAIVVGHSYGGFIAQETALRHPDRVAGLVLLNTTPGKLGATEDPADPQGDPPPPEQAALMARPVGTEDELAALMSDLAPFYLHRLDADVLRALMREMIFTPDTMVRAFQVLSSWSSVERLPKIACPTLVIGGRHDTFTSAPQSQRIALRVPGATLHIFEQSGHFPWLEEPEAFWTLVAGWLDQQADRPGALA